MSMVCIEPVAPIINLTNLVLRGNVEVRQFCVPWGYATLTEAFRSGSTA